jgi:hypothetical protein
MAVPTDNQTLEHALGGLPLVLNQGLNTNAQANFSGTIIDTSGGLNIVTAEITATAGTGGTATFTSATVGGAAGGPSAVGQDGWLKLKIAGTSVWVPVWK